jgi:nitroimidazol reductase NimA-like FMN-containing flavoprotein (pyridoxamine 5'-phosphate oxidase superfamily)
MISEMNEMAARQFLRNHTIGHLGCILGTGEPYVIPVSYFLRNDGIYIHCLPGLKLDAMRSSPNVCFEVTKAVMEHEWESVIAFGKFHEITDPGQTSEILTEMFARFERLTPVEALSMDRNDDLPVIVFRIEIQRITGRTES